MNLKATTIAISSLFVCTTLWAGEFASQTIRLAHTAAVSHAHHEAAFILMFLYEMSPLSQHNRINAC